MAPFALDVTVGKFATYAIYVLIGMGFGASLEMAGFGYSTKLTAQFYLRDMTVFKVMFTAVLVSMVLAYGAVGLGLLDYDRIWIPPTYLIPGTLGGLLVGIGFIIGGFCPGTSVASLATLKKDAIFFLVGILGGIVLFGETSSSFGHFYNSTYMGRLTLPDVLGLPAGVTVLIVVVMGIFALWGAEQLEAAMRRKDGMEVNRIDKRVALGAGALILAGLAVLLIGQPTAAERWQRIEPEKQALLDNREVQIHPAELRDVYYNSLVNLVMLDVRDEADYNLFHVKDARRVPLSELEDTAAELKTAPPGTVAVLMSNDETLATEGWKTLTAMGVPNVYILEGGINNFIGTCQECPFKSTDGQDEELRYEIYAALGGNHPEANLHEHGQEIQYTPKVKIESQAPVGGGGCG
jgi:rhodanese-related sulfurtransferase